MWGEELRLWEEGGGVEIVWFGVSERELKLKTTLQRRLVVKG